MTKFNLIIIFICIVSSVIAQTNNSIAFLENKGQWEDNVSYKKGNMVGAFKFLSTAFPRKAISFLISDEIDASDSEVEKYLKISNRQHDFIFTRIYDPLEKEISLKG